MSQDTHMFKHGSEFDIPLSSILNNKFRVGDELGINQPSLYSMPTSLPSVSSPFNTNHRTFELKLVNAKVLEYGMPTYAHDTDASVDLRAMIDEPFLLKAGKRHTFPTGLAVFVKDPEIAAFVDSRSGLAHKHGLHVLNGRGTIDAGYQNEIGVILHNAGDDDYTIAPGERIAQLNFQYIIRASFKVVKDFGESTDRGTTGFGHSGKI